MSDLSDLSDLSDPDPVIDVTDLHRALEVKNRVIINLIGRKRKRPKILSYNKNFKQYDLQDTTFKRRNTAN